MLCTDEAHRAYFSDDIRRQVAEAMGIPPDPKHPPHFLRRLRATCRGLPADEKRLRLGLFAVVSETLISSILAQLPGDERVVTAVREMVANHAADEGRHGAFFSQFFVYLGPGWPTAVAPNSGRSCPSSSACSWSPIAVPSADRLPACPFGVTKSRPPSPRHTPANVTASARAAASATLHLFQRTGVMEDARLADAFRAHGLHE
jgi:hypothetical protein